MLRALFGILPRFYSMFSVSLYNREGGKNRAI